MAALCIGGVCVPYSAIVPLIMVLLQYLLRPLAKLGIIPSWMADKLGVAVSDVMNMTCDGSCEEDVSKSSNSRRTKKSHSNQTVRTMDSTSTDDSQNCSSSAHDHDSIEKDYDDNGTPITIQSIESEEEFHRMLNATDIVIAKFTADWCKPCKAIQPAFQQMASKYVNNSSNDVKIVTVDVDDVDDISSKYKITMMPTFIAFQHGKPVASMSGVNESKLQAFLKEAILGP